MRVREGNNSHDVNRLVLEGDAEVVPENTEPRTDDSRSVHGKLANDELGILSQYFPRYFPSSDSSSVRTEDPGTATRQKASPGYSGWG